MNISNMQISKDGLLEITLTDDFQESGTPCFCERLDPNIWGVHYRKYAFQNEGERCFSFNGEDVLATFAYHSEKIFDLFLVDKETKKEKALPIQLEKSYVDGFSQIVETEYGNIKCQYYKNGSGNLSLRASLIPKYSFTVQVRENSDQFDFYPASTAAEPINWCFARKTTADASNRYDLTLEMSDYMNADGHIVVSLSDILGDYAQGGKEKWEFVAELDGLFFNVTVVNDYESEMIEINDSTKGKIQCTNGQALRIFTYENDCKNQSKIKVSVMGTCFSRQAFNSKEFFNSDYKRFYECGLTAYHQSIPSILSSAITIDPSELVGEFQSDLNAYGKSHFEKTYLPQLKEYKPDYLMVENYVHITAPLIELRGGRYVDENYYLVDSPAYKNLKIVKKIPAEGEEHFEIYKKYLLKFKDQIKGIIPTDRIVLIRTQPALYKNDNGVVSRWDSEQIILHRRYMWERYDSAFLAVFPQARVIDMRDEKYISERSPHFKFAPSHFGSAYYKDILYHFNKIVLQDLIKCSGEKRS